jgi:dethiobiotin synthetase
MKTDSAHRPPPSALFIAATDTGAGKTLATAALAILLRRHGRPVRVLKPVATGGLPGEDALLLSRVTDQPVETISGWTFREPAAPPVAARAEGATLDLADMVEWVRVREPREPGELLLVEGVGGLLCPLTDEATVADLITALGYPVLLLARRGLGTLNHTLLTVEAARQRKIDVVGVLLTETQPATSLAEASAPEELARRGVPVLGVLPHRQPPDPERLADDLAATSLLACWPRSSNV